MSIDPLGLDPDGIETLITTFHAHDRDGLDALSPQELAIQVRARQALVDYMEKVHGAADTSGDGLLDMAALGTMRLLARELLENVRDAEYRASRRRASGSDGG